MTQKLRIVMAQLNLLVGDIEGNLQKHLDAAQKARDVLKADAIVFPELSLTGYPAEDLLLRKDFIKASNEALKKCQKSIKGIYAFIGHPKPSKQGLQNACSVIYQGKVIACYAKQNLPNYDVFDEYRYFVPGESTCIVPIKDVPVGIVICEDVWRIKPIQQAAQQGARIIVAPNASPSEFDKHAKRAALLQKRAGKNKVPVLYVNQIGGQDELIFDGGSMVVDKTGEIKQLAGFNQEVLHPVDIHIEKTRTKIDAMPFQAPNELEKIYKGLVMGVRDYIEKNHFPGVIVGVSGGIDSALTLAIAVDALGKDRVSACFMPSRFTSEISAEEAKAVTDALQVKLQTISIEKPHQGFLDVLAPAFEGLKPDVTEENIQSRCRAVILMALSNKTGSIVLTTGNRSELSVGYTTLYGDMAGGFGVLKDIPKTLVYKLAEYRNRISPVIPERTITRAPTAELRSDQKDEDSLPPYPILDKIIELYLNHEKSIDDIVKEGIPKETVTKVINMILRNEYKRRQAPVGVRLNYKSFGKDRRYPITSGFRG